MRDGNIDESPMDNNLVEDKDQIRLRTRDRDWNVLGDIDGGHLPRGAMDMDAAKYA